MHDVYLSGLKNQILNIDGIEMEFAKNPASGMWTLQSTHKDGKFLPGFQRNSIGDGDIITSANRDTRYKIHII